MKTDNFMVTKTDLATYLTNIASSLEVNGMALRGMNAETSDVGSIEGIATSLEKTADLIKVIKAQLCTECRMMEVESKVSLKRVRSNKE